MGRAGWRRRKAALLIAVALLAAGAGIAAYAANGLRRTELQTIDVRFSIRGSEPPPPGIVLVQIDNATLQQLAREHLHSQFPFPRKYEARVIDNLRKAGASVIAMDIQFTQATDPPDDNALIEAIGRAHGKVLLGATEIGAHGSTGVLGGGSLLGELGARAGSVRLVVDTDGVVRRFPYQYSGLHSFGVVAEEMATGKPVSPSRFDRRHRPDRLRRPAGNGEGVLVLEGDERRSPVERLRRAEGDRGRVRADPAGRARDGYDQRSADGGAAKSGPTRSPRSRAASRCATRRAGSTC